MRLLQTGSISSAEARAVSTACTNTSQALGCLALCCACFQSSEWALYGGGSSLWGWVGLFGDVVQNCVIRLVKRACLPEVSSTVTVWRGLQAHAHRFCAEAVGCSQCSSHRKCNGHSLAEFPNGQLRRPLVRQWLHEQSKVIGQTGQCPHILGTTPTSCTMSTYIVHAHDLGLDCRFAPSDP